ncbi:transposase, IS4 family protein [Alkaliphilus metalliredigens QYMF]|uniref:Transposase, IS4 family protein n=1 Tax=Alkaliphilus metalliredigens (strain QYMF) TaxID=293826 RepID=A6TNC5_ALKMQ|nr:IS1182 family transposase [Alkaliphilus metalliredigens]ABR47693.1 transposase, IS4 family protein [Alkaliphilus metalliredigens QYMF]
MMGKNSGQIDVFNHMIFEKLIPKDHLLVKINSIIDFSFVYEQLREKYSHLGRGSKDPVMMVKIFLLEYIYNLSDVEVVRRIGTDIAFRWFLGLGIDDSVPDDTTISHFRINRLTEKDFEAFFNEIVRKCIEKDLVRTNRYMIDTTDVAANVNYPSDKKLIGNAYKKVIKEIQKFNEDLAKQELDKFEEEIEREYQLSEKVHAKKHFNIAHKHLEYLYLKTYDELNNNAKYHEAFSLCYDLVDQYINNKKDKIVSVVDPDARVAHKSPGNIKRGYKDHIIVDEDSEIILASVQTPFNTGDEKKLKELIEKVESNLEIKPDEISADKVYGTTDNRAYLKDNEITSNIAFYKESSRESNFFELKDFNISEDLKTVTCPKGVTTENFRVKHHKGHNKKFKEFQFNKESCDKCPLRDQCLYKLKNGRVQSRGRKLDVPLRYDAILHDMKRVKTEEFEKASSNRFKVERRFATMVRNHGLRRCRYVKLGGAKIHITMANIACNIIRMVNIIYPPNVSVC